MMRVGKFKEIGGVAGVTVEKGGSCNTAGPLSPAREG